DRRPVAMFNAAHPCMQGVIREAAPPEFEVSFLAGPTDPRAHDLLAAADFLVTVNLPAAWVARLSRCRLVQLPWGGRDGLDQAALQRAGIPLAQPPDGTVAGVAEHPILRLLAVYKRLTAVHASVRRGEFDPIDWRAQCHTFQGKTLGIVGFGRIGQR